jgi:hypothetical protein
MRTPSLVLFAALLLNGLAPQAHAASAEVIGVAPSDPIEQKGIASSGAVFTITNDYQASLVRFDQSAANMVCNRVSEGVDAAPPVALDVEWDGGQATLRPGDCARVDAPRARIAPAGHLPSYTLLQGK